MATRTPLATSAPVQVSSALPSLARTRVTEPGTPLLARVAPPPVALLLKVMVAPLLLVMPAVPAVLLLLKVIWPTVVSWSSVRVWEELIPLEKIAEVPGPSGIVPICRQSRSNPRAAAAPAR